MPNKKIPAIGPAMALENVTVIYERSEIFLHSLFTLKVIVLKCKVH